MGAGRRAGGRWQLTLELLLVSLNPGLRGTSELSIVAAWSSPEAGRSSPCSWGPRKSDAARAPRACLFFCTTEAQGVPEGARWLREAKSALMPENKKPSRQCLAGLGSRVQGDGNLQRRAGTRPCAPARGRAPARTSCDVTPVRPTRLGGILPELAPPSPSPHLVPVSFSGGGDAGVPSVWDERHSPDSGLERHDACGPGAGRSGLEGGRSHGPCLGLPGLVPRRPLPSVTTEMGPLEMHRARRTSPKARRVWKPRSACPVRVLLR